MQNPVTETRQEGQRLERLMSDVLLLVDIVAAKSDKAELISEDEPLSAKRLLGQPRPLRTICAARWPRAPTRGCASACRRPRA